MNKFQWLTIALLSAILFSMVGSIIYFRHRLNARDETSSSVRAQVISLNADLTKLLNEAVFDSEIPRAASDLMKSASRSDLLLVRSRIVAEIWGQEGFPSSGKKLVEQASDEHPFYPLKGIDLIADAGPAGVSNMLFIEAAGGEAPCLVVYHSGHGEGLRKQMKDDAASLMRLALNLDCDILHASMPLEGDNGGQSLDGVPSHDVLGTLDEEGNPLRWFVEPVILGINWATERKDYSRVVLTGRSGGGWTVGLVGAIDPRIDTTISFSGSMPSLVKGGRAADQGDWEQTAASIYEEVDYGDLYLLSALEDGREAFYSWNKYDTCCFAGARAKVFFPMLQATAGQWGIDGLHYIVDETPGVGHSIPQSGLGFLAEIIITNR